MVEPDLVRGRVRSVLDISPWVGLDVDEHMKRFASYANRLSEEEDAPALTSGVVVFACRRAHHLTSGALSIFLSAPLLSARLRHLECPSCPGIDDDALFANAEHCAQLR